MTATQNTMLKVVGLLAINEGLEIWVQEHADGKAITNGRFVGANRKFLQRRTAVTPDVINAMIRNDLLAEVCDGEDHVELRLALNLIVAH